MKTLVVTVSDRLGKMDTALRKKGDKGVSYRSFVGQPEQAWQPTGAYRFDPSQGHIVQIVDELVTAMEITHGLMLMDGFPGVFVTGGAREDEKELIAAFTDTVQHPAMRNYLRKFEFEKEYEMSYERKVTQWIQATEMLALADQDLKAASIQALRFVEAMLTNPSFRIELGKVSARLPSSWTLANLLYKRTFPLFGPTQRNVWESLVVLVKEVSRYFESANSPLVSRLTIIPPVISDAEVDAGALDVFDVKEKGIDSGHVIVEISYRSEPLSCVEFRMPQAELSALLGRLSSCAAAVLSEAISSSWLGDSRRMDALASNSNSL